MPTTFSIGQKVFAKIRGHPPWPAVVNGIFEKSNSKQSYSVFLYEMNMNVELSGSKLKEYHEHIHKSGKQLTSILMLSKAVESSISDSIHQNLEQVDHQQLPKPLTTEMVVDEVRKEAQHVEEVPPLVHGSAESDKINKYWMMQNLRSELILLACDFIIKSSLTLQEANCTPCLKALNKILRLRLNEIMLIKHPDVVETVLKLRKYVGNSTKWRQCENEKQRFDECTKAIRRKANTLYLVFRKIFRVSDGCDFMEIYSTRVTDEFRRNIKHLSKTKW